jgi:hypothetical protein
MPPEPSISNLKQINVVKKQDNLLSKLLILRSRVKTTFAFFDGQNLFYAAKEAFGYRYPNYAPWLLADAVCKRQGMEK